MSSRITLLPSARRLMASLREIGYDLPSAVADIVDNSLTARARRIDITFRFDGAGSSILIADDGSGMTGSVLEEAMRYGTERSYRDDELGRFGLGLKTASLSQCRRLTVASRRGRERRRLAVRRWDLDHVVRSNRWEAFRVDASQAPPEMVESLMARPGTTVMWEGLDRIMDYRLPTGAAARYGFRALTDEVSAHLGMVFHRFLAGEARGHRRVTMYLNGKRIDAWDPFCRSEPHTRELTPQVLGVSIGDGTRRVTVRPYVLPSQERFSSAEAHAIAAGPLRWNRQQGFYIYRRDRLIQAGGWSRLRTSDEHTKLARVAVDIPVGCEETFRVNVAKMRVSIPVELRESMTAIASGVASQAGSTYRTAASRSSRISHPAWSPTKQPSLVSTLSNAERDVLSIVIDLSRDEFRDEPDVLRRLLSRIERLSASVISQPSGPYQSVDVDNVPSGTRQQKHSAWATIESQTA